VRNRRCQSLVRVDLSCCCIGDSLLIELHCLALKNAKFEHVSFDYNDLPEPGLMPMKRLHTQHEMAMDIREHGWRPPRNCWGEIDQSVTPEAARVKRSTSFF